jgi:hypothetical protein
MYLAVYSLSMIVACVNSLVNEYAHYFGISLQCTLEYFLKESTSGFVCMCINP